MKEPNKIDPSILERPRAMIEQDQVPSEQCQPSPIRSIVLVSTFNESIHDGDFMRTGIEISIRWHKLRAGWISGYLPTFFYCGLFYGTESGVLQNQLRVWRLAISYANDKLS